MGARQCLARCVRIACRGPGMRSALSQARYGAGIGPEPTIAKCLQMRVF
jgi:hypothetical protein